MNVFRRNLHNRSIRFKFGEWGDQDDLHDFRALDPFSELLIAVITNVSST